MDKFEEDMKSAELVNLMRADIAEAGQLGVTGTPTVFINGRKLKERSLPGFQTLIDEELRKLKQKDAASGS
jgi:protein-disulfide isomerase